MSLSILTALTRYRNSTRPDHRLARSAPTERCQPPALTDTWLRVRERRAQFDDFCTALSSDASTGSLRRRFPVRAKIAFTTAGAIVDVPGSPIPPGSSLRSTMWAAGCRVPSLRCGRQSGEASQQIRSTFHPASLARKPRPARSIRFGRGLFKSGCRNAVARYRLVSDLRFEPLRVGGMDSD